MSKIALTCVGIAAAGLLTLIRPSMAEEHHDKPAEKTKHGEEVKAGTKGETVGTIVSKEKSNLVVSILQTTPTIAIPEPLVFAPYWRGGSPKDGGGLDKETVSKLEKFAVGDVVRITWTWEERRRIDTITKVNGPKHDEAAKEGNKAKKEELVVPPGIFIPKLNDPKAKAK